MTLERLEEMHRIHAANSKLGEYAPAAVRQMNADICAALEELIENRQQGSGSRDQQTVAMWAGRA